MLHDPSSVGRRLGAMLYESLVVFAILIAFFIFPQMIFVAFGWQPSGKLQWLHIFFVLMAYFVWCWLHGGQTLPMKTWKLRIESANGTPLRPLQAILRYMAAWPSIVLGGIGLAWALFDRDGQFLHDRLAGTRIVRLRDSAPLDPPDQAARRQQKKR